MSVKLITEPHLDSLSSKGCCICSPEPTIVKMPHCWKSHVMAQLCFPFTDGALLTSIRPISFLPESADAYTYSGSATTPPCRQNIQWVIYRRPIILSKTAVSSLASDMLFLYMKSVHINTTYLFSAREW